MTSSTRLARQAAAAAALVSVAGLVAACSASSGQSGPTKTVTVTASPSASVATTQGGSPSATPTPAPSAVAPSSAGAAAACPTRSLQVKHGAAQGAAGSTYTAIDFVNISNATCTLYGYPGVSLAGGTPVTQIGLAAAQSHASPRELVTLAPHGIANALLRIVNAANFPASKCGPAKARFLQIYPPNQTTPIYLGFTSQACSKPVQLLTIGVVQPGAGSSS